MEKQKKYQSNRYCIYINLINIIFANNKNFSYTEIYNNPENYENIWDENHYNNNYNQKKEVYSRIKKKEYITCGNEDSEITCPVSYNYGNIPNNYNFGYSRKVGPNKNVKENFPEQTIIPADKYVEVNISYGQYNNGDGCWPGTCYYSFPSSNNWDYVYDKEERRRIREEERRRIREEKERRRKEGEEERRRKEEEERRRKEEEERRRKEEERRRKEEERRRREEEERRRKEEEERRRKKKKKEEEEKEKKKEEEEKKKKEEEERRRKEEEERRRREEERRREEIRNDIKYGRRCPYCESTNVGKWKKGLRVLTGIFTLGISEATIHKRYCYNCDNYFSAYNE